MTEGVSDFTVDIPSGEGRRPVGACLSLQEASLEFLRTICHHPRFSIRKLADPRLPFGENSLLAGKS